MEIKTCCVTRHRNIPAEQIEYVKDSLLHEIETAIAEGYTHFISGFAEGVDEYFSEIVAEMKKENINLQLIAAIPYRKRLKSLQNKEKFKTLLEACSDIEIIEEEYIPSAYYHRNYFMVTHSDRVIAVYDGREKGGTAVTIRYTQLLGKELREIPICASALITDN